MLRDYLTIYSLSLIRHKRKDAFHCTPNQGGGLFETGAGVQLQNIEQLLKENHLRWDSLGEFTAIAASLDHFGNFKKNKAAIILGNALDIATQKILESGRSPSPSVGEIDNRGSHFYLAQFWAEALGKQAEDPSLASRFQPIYRALRKTNL